MRSSGPESSVGPRARRPRVGFVVQRCGLEVNGGAEMLCLQVAQRMARHWQTEVLTTCALDYMTWTNFYPEGVEQVGATSVRRFPVDQPRDVAAFDKLSAELNPRRGDVTLSEQEAWMRAQGPCSTPLLDYLRSHAGEYDGFLFFGYLYATTYFGLPIVKDKAYLAPLAHDEWPIYFPMWEPFFRLPKGFIFQTPEERDFLRRRFPAVRFTGPEAGVGIDPPAAVDAEGFRRKYGLERPFLLYAGRFDASKGCGQLVEWFRSRSDALRDLQLVLIGAEVLPVPYDPDIVYLGFVSQQDKWNAMAACSWLILPSQYESLSIALLETWLVGRPAIVNASSAVLRGHCERSHGGVWYRDWAECEALLRFTDDTTATLLGKQGRAYVLAQYAWQRIESAYRNVIC